MKICAFCGTTKFGMVNHRHWNLRFCTLAHKKAYQHRQAQEREADARRRGWLAFLARGSP